MQQLSRPPPIQKLCAENHMLQLNIWCYWWWAYILDTCRAKNTLIKSPCCIKLAFQIISWGRCTVKQRSVNTGFPASWHTLSPLYTLANPVTVSCFFFTCHTGTEIATIEARDADSGDFGKVTYLLDRMSSQVTDKLDHFNLFVTHTHATLQTYFHCLLSFL